MFLKSLETNVKKIDLLYIGFLYLIAFVKLQKWQ